jgi:superfamily II DNA or RNA helicase
LPADRSGKTSAFGHTVLAPVPIVPFDARIRFTMEYFRRYNDLLQFPLKLKEEEVGLRECQMGAVWAVRAHFTSGSSPALVAMPTGSGKTAVMMLLSFVLGAKRVLVIEPGAVLRDQTEEKFATLSDLVKSRAFARTAPKPRVCHQEGRITSRAQWEKLRNFDVVVATPHTVSRDQDKTIVAPPDDLFDLVFFDEAHHARAKTWQRLIEDVARSRLILLTATPFRLDGRILPGKLVYNYPMQRALDTGVYRPIEYKSARSSGSNEIDEQLCRIGKRLLANE